MEKAEGECRSVMSCLGDISDMIDASEMTLEYLKSKYIDKLYSKIYYDPLSNAKMIQNLLNKSIKSTELASDSSFFILSLIGELYQEKHKFTPWIYKTREANKRLYLTYVSQLSERRTRGSEKYWRHHQATKYLYWYRLVPSLSLISKYGGNYDLIEDPAIKLKNAKIDQIAVSLDIFANNLNFWIHSDDTEYGRLFESEGKIV